MPGKSIRKIISAAVIAAAVSTAVFGVYTYSSPAPKNGSAVVYFLSDGAENGIVQTDVTRQISSLRRFLRDNDTLTAVEQTSPTFRSKEIRSCISVSRLEGTDAAEIVLSGLSKPSDAPLYLVSLLDYAASHSGKGSDDAGSELYSPEFYVVSYCDIPNEPVFPVIPAALMAGALSGSLFYLLKPSRRKHSRHHDHSHHYTAPAENNEQTGFYVIEDYCLERLENLGTVSSSASEGMEKSGHNALAGKTMKHLRGKILAISAADCTKEAADKAAKTAAYLACAYAKMDGYRPIRVLIADCDLTAPKLAEIFRIKPKAGLSDIAAGTSKIWDAAYMNARSGVDLIAESRSYPAPAAVFGSGTIQQTFRYLSAQYDMVILLAPPAWSGSECEIIYKEADGVMLCLEQKRIPPNIVQKIDTCTCRLIGYCICEDEKKPAAEDTSEQPAKKKKKQSA